VEKGFHGVLSKCKWLHLEKTPPPFEGRGFRIATKYYEKLAATKAEEITPIKITSEVILAKVVAAVP